MKKLSIFMAALFVVMLFIGIQPAYAAQYSLDFEETAEAVYMINLDTGTVVFEKMPMNAVPPLPSQKS